MRQEGFAGRAPRYGVCTTVPDPKAPCPLDRVNWHRAERPNQLWVSTSPTPPTWQVVYVAFVVDVQPAHRGLAPEQFDAHRVRARCAGAGSV